MYYYQYLLCLSPPPPHTHTHTHTHTRTQTQQRNSYAIFIQHLLCRDLTKLKLTSNYRTPQQSMTSLRHYIVSPFPSPLLIFCKFNCKLITTSLSNIVTTFPLILHNISFVTITNIIKFVVSFVFVFSPLHFSLSSRHTYAATIIMAVNH